MTTTHTVDIAALQPRLHPGLRTTGQYFCTAEGRPFTAGDACALAELRDDVMGRRYALHEDGFPIFIPPSQLAASDEYAEGDPYNAADGFEQFPAFQNRRLNSTLKILREALRESATDRAGAAPRILDLACGEGVITAQIHKHLPDAELYGIDYALTAIEAAARRGDPIHYAVGDAYQLPYAAGFFDVIVCNNIWEHVPDPLRLLAGVKKVLKPGGHVIISTPSRYRFRNMVRVCLGLPVVFLSTYHVTEYSVGQVLEQLRWGGMEPRVFDDPLEGPAGGFMRFVAFKMAVPVIRALLRLARSHHSPEETVFYLARNRG